MMIVNLAWKNVWRNRTRSIVILLSVLIGLVVGTFAVGFMNGWIEEKLNSVADYEQPHLQVNTTQFIESKGDVEALFAFEKLEHDILSIPTVQGVSPRYVVNAMVATSHKTGGIQAFGIDTQKEAAVSKFDYSKLDSAANLVMVGKEFAEKYKVKKRQKIVLSMITPTGEQVSGAFRIADIFSNANPAFEETRVYVRASDLQALASLPSGEVHELAIRLTEQNNKTLHLTQSEIAAKITSDKEVRTWKQINATIALFIDFAPIEMMIIVAIILIGLGFGIVNTVLMSVMERERELKMLMAIGMNRRSVRRMILLESLFLTMLGGIIGMIIGYILIALTAHAGIDISASMGSVSQLGFSTMIYPVISASQFFEIAIMVVLTGILSAIYPAGKATKF